METVNPASTGGDLSLIGLFLQADWIVKTVMLLIAGFRQISRQRV